MVDFYVRYLDLVGNCGGARMILLQHDTTNEMVDIDEVMAKAMERWQVFADRRWVLDARAGE